jgi:hypothetical protein
MLPKPAHDRPFYHSVRTGGAEGYEKIVGSALLASTRVLVIWSENAWRSSYVRAELLVAIESKKEIAAYIQPGTPIFPVDNITAVHDHQTLRSLLSAWRSEMEARQGVGPGADVNAVPR